MAQTLQKTGNKRHPLPALRRFDFGSLIRRPETGAFLGLVFVFVFFAIFGGVNFVAPDRARRATSTSRPTSASWRCPSAC